LVKERAAVRHRFQAERPAQAELLASGDVDQFVPLGEFLELQEAIHTLKQHRRAARLSLTAVASRCNLDKEVLVQLEDGQHANVTVDCLRRYAEAVGAELSLRVVTKSRRTSHGN
jgi:hypothetical protein